MDSPAKETSQVYLSTPSGRSGVGTRRYVHNDEPALVIEAIRWVLGGGEGF